MAKKKKKIERPHKGGKIKYVKPKMTRHGNLETVAQRIAGAIGSSCCITERLRASRTSRTKRESLVGYVTRVVAYTASR